MVTKKEFTDYMTELHGDDNDYSELYKSFKTLSKIKDSGQIKELRDLTKMDKHKRLLYRHALASNGREYTPSQVDQYLSTIEYALLQIDENN
jgi:hypothetical protein